MWLGLFNPDPDRGYLNALLVLIPGVKSVAWLGNMSTVQACIFVVLTWKYFGLNILLFVAGLLNIALFAADPWQVEQSNRQLEFFNSQGIEKYVNQYTLDGKPLSREWSTGLMAMNAVAALAATTDKAPEFVQALWDAQIPVGKWRYLMGWCILWPSLYVSGNFRIYPAKGPQGK